MAVLANDSITGNPTVSSTTLPLHGTVTINADGTLFYVPDPGYIGSDSFSYTVVNDIGGSDTAAVSVNVVAAVMALYDSAATDTGLAVSIPVMANDIGAQLIYSFTQPAFGTVSVSGNSLVYTPFLGHAGADTFEYTISGGQSQTASATVSVFTRGNVSGQFWLDENADGMLDVDEPAVAGVRVELYDSSASFVGFQTTDSEGRYTFPTSKLADGMYTLRFQDADTIVAYSGIEYTLQNVVAPPGVSVSAAGADGWTNPFAVVALQPPVKKDAGVKSKTVSIAEGTVTLGVAPLQGVPVFQKKNAQGIPVILPLKLVDVDDNIYALELASYDAQTDMAVTKQGNLSFKLAAPPLFYSYGALAVGKFVEAGHENDTPQYKASSAFYWSQYVKSDKSETVSTSFGTWVPNSNGVDGKWYLDGKQFAIAGLKNSYAGQDLDIKHRYGDQPGLNFPVASVAGKDPAAIRDEDNKLYMFVQLERESVVTEAMVNKIKAANGGQHFTAGYSNSFETYVVQKAGTTPLMHYLWGWSVHLDSKTGYSVSITAPAQGANKSDPAVWDVAPSSPL
ncbi:MAG: Ig-like domain-containing protein [Gemmataceae bacterium]